MPEWKFDLTQTTDPYQRLGLHGLWSLLTYGPDPEVSPCHSDKIQQTDTLKWTLTDTTITISWSTVDDLHVLMQNMLGDFRHGVGTPPGYPQPDSDSFYATCRQHQGIVGSYFFEKKGERRSTSLGGTTPEKKQLFREHTAVHGTPITMFSRLQDVRGTTERPMTIDVKLTPHTQETCNPLTLDHIYYSTAFHPALAAWNLRPIRCRPEIEDEPSRALFVSAFSCLAYIFTMCGKNPVGLGIDLPTFSVADDMHNRWCHNTDSRCTLWVDGDTEAALWVIAATLCLPEGIYSALTPEGCLMWQNSLHSSDTTRLYAALGHLMESRALNRRIQGMYGIPVQFRNGETSKYLVPTLVYNLKHDFPFYRGMSGIRLKSHNQRVAAYNTGDSLMTDIEKEVAEWMRKLYRQYERTFVEDGRGDAYNRAYEKGITVGLGHARHREGIFAVIRSMHKAVGYRLIPPNVYEYLVTQGDSNPNDLREFLCLACALQNPTPTNVG